MVLEQHPQQRDGMTPFPRWKKRIILTSITAAALIALAASLVVILRFQSQYSVELVSTGNLPPAPFSKESKDTVFVTPVTLTCSGSLPITIRQIRVQDIDAGTALSPAIYVVDLTDDLLLESAGFSTQAEFLDRYRDRINPLKHAPEGRLSPENQTFQSDYICIFLLFDHFPPPHHRVRVTCEYELFHTAMTAETLLRRD